jgi:hypothetical protein
MLERLRYLTKRVNRRGDVRWYWQRPVFPLTRLPDDYADRLNRLTELNAIADAEKATATVAVTHEPLRGTIGWVIQKYRSSDDYLGLAPNSKKTYKRFLADVEKLGMTLPFASFTRRAVVDFVESYPRTSQRRIAGTVLKVLTRVALYHGLIAADPTAKLRLRRGPPRERIWTDHEKAYLPRGRELAQAAITKLAEFKK